MIWTCKKEVRQTDRGFYGAGLPHMGVKNMIECSNKLLVYYGCSTRVGLKLQASIEVFIVELGISIQPFGIATKNTQKR